MLFLPPIVNKLIISQLYIDDKNVSADPIDFKKALDLMEYLEDEVEDDLREELRLHIW